MKKKILFIINPLSGGKTKNLIPFLIDEIIDNGLYEIEKVITKSEGDTLALSATAKKENFDAVVGVGGDGTLNNIARFLSGSDIALGIVPMGSGNGFARELNIPLDSVGALKLINKFNTKLVDTGKVNDNLFLNVCGIGFDAYITGLFAGSVKRGFRTYAFLTFKEMHKYQSQTYQLIVDGKLMNQRAFMIVICNGTQFGNNAYIAPDAKHDDGLFNVTLIEDFKWTDLLNLGPRLFFKRIHHSKKVKTFTGKKIQIIRNNPDFINIDGEPFKMGNELTINIQALSLKVIVP